MMEQGSPWRDWGRYAAAAVAAGVITWIAFVSNREVPVFDWVDLGIHELGHMLMFSGPRMLHFLAGSFLQVAFPLSMAIYFYIRQKDRAGVGFCLAWAGTSAWDVSVYIADAPIQALPLIGGGQHDWAYLLGSQGFNAIGRAGQIAGFVETIGLVMAIAGIGIAVWPAVRRGHAAIRGAAPIEFSSEELPFRSADPADGGVGDERPDGAPVIPGPAGPDRALRPNPTGDPWLAAARMPFFHDEGDASR